MEIAFLMDSLESIDPLMETTSHLMYECNQRGHTVYFFEPHDIYIRRGEVVARMRNISTPPNLSMKKYWRSVITAMRPAWPIPVTGKNPATVAACIQKKMPSSIVMPRARQKSLFLSHTFPVSPVPRD